MYNRVAISTLKRFATLLLAAGLCLSASAAEQQNCYLGLCAKLSVAETCPQPGETVTLQLQGTLEDGGSFSITTYELLRGADWTYLDNHQIQLNSYDKVLSNDGFVLGGRFSNSISIDPREPQRLTLIHRYRSNAHGFYATAAELTLEGSASCVQMQLDIKPGSCPNPVNIDNKGVTPVAIIGSTALNVRDLDLTSIRLEGVAALRYRFEDVTAPIPEKSSILECTTSSDGIEDLALKFLTQELATALEARLGRPPFDGEIISLELTARTKAGVLLNAQDHIQVLVKRKP